MRSKIRNVSCGRVLVLSPDSGGRTVGTEWRWFGTGPRLRRQTGLKFNGENRGEGEKGAVTIMGNSGKPVMSSDVFARVRARLKAAVGEDVYSSWFARLELEEIVDDLAHLSVPTRFLCSWIQSNYAEKILDSFKAETPDIARLHFTVRVNGQARPRESPAADTCAQASA